jgi:hypothetical protein
MPTTTLKVQVSEVHYQGYHKIPPDITINTENSLQSLTEDRHQDGKYQLSHIEKVRIKFLEQKTIFILSQAQLDKLRPVLNEKPTYWRLVIPNAESDQSEELVLSMQGVITNKELPPVLNK